MHCRKLLKHRLAILSVTVYSFLFTQVSSVEAFNLQVWKYGNGTGTVTSTPAGIDCGGTCLYDFGATTDITLEATPEPGTIFTGWSGCDSVNGTECTISVTEDSEVSAFFGVETTAAYYVSTSGNDDNSGKGWARAFRRIEKALEVAESGDEIWVRAGNYYPPDYDLTSTITVAYYGVYKKVSLYGGFSGNETARAQRDWEDNRTRVDAYHYISGKSDWSGQGFYIDTQGDTGPGERARIDGFIVDNGNALGPANSRYAAGGGIHIEFGSNPIIANSEFLGNDGYDGGAILSGSNGVVIINCNIHDNTAERRGGGIYAHYDTEVINSTIYRNRGGYGGGGITFWRSGKIVSSTITGNSSPYGGSMGGSGGVYRHDGGSGITTIHNSIIWGNTGPGGDPWEIGTFGSEVVNVSYSNIRGGYTGTGNVDSDPLFGYLGGGDLKVQPFTLGINGGSNSLLPLDTTDIDDDGDVAESLPIDCAGYERVTDGVVDMGAFEYAAGRYNEYPLSVTVKPSGLATVILSGSPCGTSCNVNVYEGTELVIEVDPDEPYRAGLWKGCNYTQKGQCFVNFYGAKDIVVNLVEKTADSDSDGMEDWWEYYYFGDLKQKASGDYDGDGISNEDEYYVDSDDDGLGDGWELMFWDDPLVGDASGDDDGDGKSNLQEFQDGTNPVPLCGDISDDAVVDVTDLIMTLQVQSGEPVAPIPGGDCNDDTIIGMDETLNITQEVAQ